MVVISQSPTAASGEAATPEPLVVLYREHFTSLFRAAALLLGRADEAEEIVQEAFVRTLQAWPRLRDAERAGAYVRSATFNLARSRIRRWIVVRRRPIPREVTQPSAEEHSVLREEHRAVLAELRRLPKRQRECLVLRYYLELPLSEAAAVLGISMGSVKTHTHRGIEQIRARLEAQP
jgi:RNA polymerase sigma-70 factor (sigma-E family)